MASDYGLHQEGPLTLLHARGRVCRGGAGLLQGFGHSVV